MDINQDIKRNVDKVLRARTMKTSTWVTLIGINVTIICILAVFIILNLIGKHFFI